MTLRPRRPTIVEALLELEGCDRYGARFIPRSGDPTYYPYRTVLERAKSAAGALQQHGLVPGDRVGIVLPTSIHFLDTFLGVQLAGGIPAALYPPLRLGKLAEYYTRTQRMLEKIGARFLVTDAMVGKLLGPAIAAVPCLERVFEAADLLTGVAWTPVPARPEAPAFLQFSSGTTIEPKAVVVSHAGLVHNLEMMDQLFRRFGEAEAEAGGVCWLPLYHDMGLVGCMFVGLYHPGTVTYLGPELFLSRPALWLQAMSRYRTVISPAPDFAYGLCVAKIRDDEMDGVDLSSWRIALNGAEPIDTEGLGRFTERFARWGFRPEALTPVYGLAEAGLAVTFADPWTPPRVTEFDGQRLWQEAAAVPGTGRRLASVGRPLPGIRVELRDEADQPVGAGRVGRILIQGPSVTPGYYNDAELTARSIKGGWLDTGDLGFFHAGELYIAGRAKDLIIIRGRNYAPQEIEELLVGIAGLRTGCTVALGHSVEGAGEQLLVLGEKDQRVRRADEDIVAEIRARILSGIALLPNQVQLLQPGTLPRTSSGKLRRAEALRLWLSGGLAPPRRMGTIEVVKEIGRSQLAWARFRLRRRRGSP